MTLLISTAYLPSISYITSCLQSEELLIEQFETYPKQTSRNHCFIYGPNGVQKLSIPIKKYGNHTLTKDIRISISTQWKRYQWRSIETAYNNSPFFLYYKDELEKVFERSSEFLIELNTQLLETIFRMLRITKKISFTPEFLKNPDGIEDQRESSKNKEITDHVSFPPYTQVFAGTHGFVPNLSIIDLIFNLGPDATEFLISGKNTIFAKR